MSIKTFFAKSNEEQENQYYPFIVLTQILIIIEALILENALKTAEILQASAIRDGIFLITGGTYLFLNWLQFKNRSSKPIYSVFIFGILAILILIILILLNPIAPLYTADDDLRPFLMPMHTTLFILEVIFIVSCINDIFAEKTATLNKLWGAACIYLMIGISFGSIYDIICIWKPLSLGKYFTLGIATYTECIAYSMTVISGTEPNHTNPSILIKNISILEAIWSNLFVMILVGRLLGLPAQKKDEN